MYWKKMAIVTMVAVTITGVLPGMTSAFADTYDGGSGTEEDPYQITVAGEKLRFVRRPDLGYVVKSMDENAHIETMEELKHSGNKGIRRIAGLRKRNISVVHHRRSGKDNYNTIRALRKKSHIRYSAPLFTSNCETVAIIPEIVVRLKSPKDKKRLADLCQTMNLAIYKKMEFTEYEYLLDVLGPDFSAVFASVKQLNNADFIEWACPNTASEPKLCGRVIPNDMYFNKQWNLDNTGQSLGTPDADINAPEAWEITTGDPSIVIAVLDNGIDLNHPDLIDNLVPGCDFVDDDNDPAPHGTDDKAHGTACAGLAGARGNNGIGVSGVSWNCRIMPIVIEEESGKVPESVMALAFRWAANNGADILSNSWTFGSVKPILHSAIKDITEYGGIGRDGKGCVVVAATGNGYRFGVRWPAAYPEVIGVGATDHNDVKLDYSNWGPELDIMAPSGPYWSEEGRLQNSLRWLWSTDLKGEDGWDQWNIEPNMPNYTDCMWGTSASTPQVAAVAALLLSVDPSLTGDEVKNILVRSAKDLGSTGRDNLYGYGRVDAFAAVDRAMNRVADVTGDGVVDREDLSKVGDYWLTDEPLVDIYPRPGGDGMVDMGDFAVLTRYWLRSVGLVAHWALDGDYTDNANDHHGTKVGDPVFITDNVKVGTGAIQLDGVDDYVEIVGYYGITGTVSRTCAAWIKTTTTGEIMTWGRAAAGQKWVFLVQDTHGTPGAIRAEVGGGYVVGFTDVRDDMWHHVAAVMGQGADVTEIKLYVDGQLETNSTSAGPQPVNTASDADVRIGVFLGNDRYFTGLIDDVRIYDRALSPTEIAVLAN